VSLRFVGYLMLDALVGNTDRHHENWGILQTITLNDDREKRHLGLSIRMGLAPTFDHASSLGRELLDEARQRLLSGPVAMRRYIRKGMGGIFRDAETKRGMAPIELAERVGQTYPKLLEPWRRRIEALPDDFARPILEGIPGSEMSDTAREFVLAFLTESRKMLTSIL
jgi:hypothetical protein